MKYTSYSLSHIFWKIAIIDIFVDFRWGKELQSGNAFHLSLTFHFCSRLEQIVYNVYMFLISIGHVPVHQDHHGFSSGWSSTWFHSNTGLSSTQYEQIPIIFGVWPFWLTPFFFFSQKHFGGFLWLNCISSIEITLFLLADILLQPRALFQC